MAQPIIPGDGGVWVLMEENAAMCEIEALEAATPFDTEGEVVEDKSRGPLIAFAATVVAALLHLAGGA